ncbi:hypothetical protein FCX34_25875 [Escherichia coli]|nr:hypothetical protein [Escherichia coli]
MPENPASYRVVRTKSYLFNKAPKKFKSCSWRFSFTSCLILSLILIFSHILLWHGFRAFFLPRLQASTPLLPIPPYITT